MLLARNRPVLLVVFLTLFLVSVLSKEVHAQGALPSLIDCRVSDIPQLNPFVAQFVVPFMHYCAGEGQCVFRPGVPGGRYCNRPPAVPPTPTPTPPSYVSPSYASPIYGSPGYSTPYFTPPTVIASPTPAPPTTSPTPAPGDLILNPPFMTCEGTTLATATLTWTFNTNPRSFRIERDFGTGFQAVGFISGLARSHESLHTSSGNYIYRVIARLADGTSVTSNTQTVTVGCGLPPIRVPAPSPSSSLTPYVTPPTVIASPTPTPTPIASMEGYYRVSFDPNFTTLIDTGDGGVFGSGNEKTIDITLTSGVGQKSVYIQFFENGQWVPATPIVASINLVTSSADAHTTPTPTPTTNPIFEQNRQQAIENLPNPGQPDYTIQPLAVGEPGGPPGPSGAPPTSLVGWYRDESDGGMYKNRRTGEQSPSPPPNVSVADGIWSIGESGPVFIPSGWTYVGGGRYLPADEAYKRQVIETRRMLGL